MEDVDDGVLLIFIHTSRALKECAQTNRNKKASADGGSVRERERAGGGERSRREREKNDTNAKKRNNFVHFNDILCLFCYFSSSFHFLFTSFFPLPSLSVSLIPSLAIRCIRIFFLSFLVLI